MKDLLAAVVVVAAVLVFVLLGVKSYQSGASLDGGWVTVFLLVFGAALGTLRPKDKDGGGPPAPPAVPAAPPAEGGVSEAQG